MITFIPAASKWLIPGLRVVTHIEAPGGAQPHLLSRLTRAVRKIASIWVGSGEADYYYGTILRDSDHLIVLSDTHRPLLSRYFAGINKKCSFIPPPPIMPIALEANGSTRTRGRELLGVSPDEFLFAYFGYIYVEKGLDPLLEAFHHVVKQRENVRLVIIGGSNEFGLKWARRPHYVEELKALTERLGIKNKVLWTGYYPTDSNIGSTYLRAADACVLPFDNGVYMNNSSFAAAAAHGLPIITTRGEILESPFVDRHNVLLCPPQDPQSLATAIDSLISDPNLRRQLRFGALELAGEWFSWDKAMQRTVEIFKRGK